MDMTLIAFFDAVGALSFLAASYYAFNNFDRQGISENFWAFLCATLFVSSLWALMVSFEWMGISVSFLDEFEQFLVGIATIGFVVSVFVKSK